MKEENSLNRAIIAAIQEKKGKNIITIDLSAIDTASVQHFIICEGNSTTQVGAIADNIRESVRLTAGAKPFAYDGYQNSQWIVIDYGNTFVHVFLPEPRRFYNLETLWEDARMTAVPDME